MEQDKFIVQPQFYVDEEGKVYCTEHTLFNKAIPRVEAEPAGMNLFGPPAPPVLSCKTCGHYFEDDCYFSAESIENIENSRDHGAILCDFCGDRIHRSMIVYQKLYYEQKFRVKMPLVCCGCYTSLKNNNFNEQAQKKLLLLGGVTILSILVFILYFFQLFFLLEWGVFGILGGLIIWGYFSYTYARKILMIYKGKKYYESLESQFKNVQDA